MRYQIRIAGKIFEGSDFKILLRRAVEAKKTSLKSSTEMRPRMLDQRSSINA